MTDIIDPNAEIVFKKQAPVVSYASGERKVVGHVEDAYRDTHGIVIRIVVDDKATRQRITQNHLYTFTDLVEVTLDKLPEPVVRSSHRKRRKGTST